MQKFRFSDPDDVALPLCVQVEDEQSITSSWITLNQAEKLANVLNAVISKHRANYELDKYIEKLAD